jgi:hypothetical protein
MALPRQRWSWRDVTVKSCMRWRSQGDVGRGVMLLPSIADDGAADAMLAMG